MSRPVRVLAAVALIVLASSGCGIQLPGMLPSDQVSAPPPQTSTPPPRHTVAPPTPSVQSPPASSAAPNPETSSPLPPPQIGTRVLDLDHAAFTSPTGRIVCTIDTNHVRCDYLAEADWTAPKPADCTLQAGRSLSVEQSARVTCHSDSLAGIAAQGSPATSWYDPAKDAISNLEGHQQVALGYDQALRLGSFECLSQTKGVSCTNLATGAGLFISRESYQLF